MKIINIKTQLFTLLMLLLTSVGCSDEEFLTEEPKTFYTTDNIFSSETQLDQVILTMYSRLRNFKLTNDQMHGIGSDVLDAPEFRVSNAFSDYSRINAESSNFRTVYDFYYKLIATANTALAAADLEDISFESEAKKEYIIAQARFFRAYAHGMLAELFGGVPIVTEVAKEPRFDFVRSTREETYQFAIDELEAIVNDLPEITEQGGRLVRGAAQHYLSEFYLALGIESSNEGAYDQAIKYATDVIDGGTFALMTERFGSRVDEENTVTGGADVWWDLFRFGGEGDPGGGVGEDAGGRGVAFYAPTPLTEFAIWDESISAGDQRNAEHNISRKIFYNQPGDPLYGTQVPQDVIDATNEGRGWIFPIFYKLNTDKFDGLDQGENRSNIFRDEYAIRLPETILLRAEAYHRKGENQNAADDINLIRSRAQCDVLATADDVDIDYILDERARELYVEENRWNTLLRMGGTVATDRIKEYALHPHVALTLTFDYNLWPIPQSAIDRNKDVKMEQNPGWNR